MITASGSTAQNSTSNGDNRGLRLGNQMSPQITPSLDFDQSSQEIWQAARASDLDRYLAALRFPYEHRDAAMSVLAFAGEIRKIPEVVREPMMGQVRLQWWRDTLSDGGLSNRTGNPVADALCETILAYKLPTGLLLGFIDAHEFHFTTDQMPDQAALSSYYVKTEGALFQLSVRILLHQHSTLAAQASRSDSFCFLAGESFGRARTLAQLPRIIDGTPSLLPLENIGRLRDNPAPALAEAVNAVEENCHKLKREHTNLPEALRPPAARAILPTRLIPAYLEAATRAGRDPLRDIADINPIRRVWTTWRHSFSKSI